MSNLNISIIGYGKMGKLINEIATQRGIDVVSIVDPEYVRGYKEISEKSVGSADVCIDFTTQDVIVENITRLVKLEKNVVVGTTGWYNHLDEVKDLVDSSNIGLIYSTNFSIGANMYFAIVKKLLALSRGNEYDAYGIEMHHNEKSDKPSGTAKSLEKMILDITGKKVDFASIRAGKIAGIHTVGIDSEFDNIEITHSAKSRKGFAHGALLAAEFIRNKKGFYGSEEFMKYLLEERK